MLWGEHAKSYKPIIDESNGRLLDPSNNLILTHSHPSPLARKPFTGCGHFTECNKYLSSIGYENIKWL
jgi:uracil-DNA glycosylase